MDRRGGLALILCLWSSTTLAQQSWRGGDLLAADPLDCAAAPLARDPMPYDGALRLAPPERAGKRLAVVNVPKRAGIDYFDETQKGMAEAAAELGSVDLLTDAPKTTDNADQAAALARTLDHGIDGILFAANDPTLIAPSLKAALAKGIDVIGYDADAEPGAREWFVAPAEPNGIAKTLIDELAAEIGEAGSFAVVTSSANAPNQGRWITEMAAYTAKCHPGLRLLDTVEAGEDNVAAFDQVNDLIARYGPGLKGVVTLTSVATPAAAEAVTRAGLCGHVSVVGLGTPKAMQPYVTGGCVTSVILWNPVDLGYAAIYALRAVADGRLKPGDRSLAAGRLGDLAIVNGSEILLGRAFVFTAENIARFKF